MPEIAPFRGLRYNAARFSNDWSRLIAPPYDVLDQADKDALLAGEPHNIVAVDLPHVPPKSAGPDEVYADAARRLERWREEEAVVQDDAPAIYVYHQIYTHAGRSITRRMFLARMRLEPFGAGTVFPHEHTFGGPKEDRLKLMRATRCQLSPVFGLYSDPDDAVSTALNVDDRAPDVTARLEDVENRVWIVRDEHVIEAVRRQLADRAVYIADGHHRYGTALTYRDAAGELPPDHPARFVLVGCCAMEDPGCVILPTHRVISGFDGIHPGRIVSALERGMTLEQVEATDLEQLVSLDAPHDVAVYVARTDRLYTGRFTRRADLETLAPDRSPAWRELDVAYLHRIVLDELVIKGALATRRPTIEYKKLAEEAVAAARHADGIALLLKPCTMEQLRAVSEAGDLMPEKSTFFNPKLATGLVLNPLD